MISIVQKEDTLLYETECYKNRWVVDLVEKAINEVAHTITNTDKLQRRVMIRVGKYLLEKETNIRKRGVVRRIIYSDIKAAQRDKDGTGYGVQKTLLYEDFKKENEEAPPYEPPDILANVESILEQRDSLEYLIDSLARGDEKIRTMLTALASGYSEVETANIMSDVHGGKATGHRSFIKRFKKKRREAVS